MMDSFLKLILVIVFIKIDDVMTTECVEIKHPKVRNFPTLISYQGNKIPFDPRNSTKGNYVSFDFQKLNNLPKNIFVAFDSEHIIQIDLSGKSIERISDGAFLSLTCLSYLRIGINNISRLTWRTFEGLENLEELDLSRNKLKELPDMAFAATNRLVKLDLSENSLKFLSPFAFSNTSNLQELFLNRNNLFYILPEVFQPLSNLLLLDLSANKLYDTEFNAWILPNLEVLNLSGNYLRSFDTSLNYSFASLQKLNLSANYLTQLNIHALNKNFQKLTVIDLNENYWRCDYLARMLHFLADSKLRYPGRNTSEINESGIECDNNTRITFDFTEPITTTPISIVPTKNSNSSINTSKIAHQIQGMSVKNDEILLEISGIRKLLIFSLLFFVLFVIVYASVQVGLCDNIKNRFCRREGYMETSIQDNYSMLRA